MATKKKTTKAATKKPQSAANIKSKVAKKKKVVTKSTKATAKKVVAKKTLTKKSTKKAGSKKVASNTAKAKKVSKKVTKKTTKKSMSKVANDDNLIHGIEPYKEKAREKYMSPAQLEHFRRILVAWKRNLIEEVSRTIHLMQDENINHPDPNDRASQETDMSLELRNRDRERKLLKKIDSTITRLDNDDYGWCDRCGIEIGIRRLEARPTAELCVDCKTLNEIKERQMI